MRRHLVIFAKTPRPGWVKTRLCPPLAPEQAASLAEAFLLDTLALGDGLCGWERTLAYTPRGTRREMLALAPPGWRLRLQRGGDLGERLEHAITGLLGEGQAEVTILGSDAPHLAVERLQAAAGLLRRTDMVFGPCVDGGYYLIALRRAVPGMFQGVGWSTAHALEDTLRAAERHGLTWSLLERDYDVDDMRSLRRLIGDLGRLPAERLLHTRAALARLEPCGACSSREASTTADGPTAARSRFDG